MLNSLVRGNGKSGKTDFTEVYIVQHLHKILLFIHAQADFLNKFMLSLDLYSN